MPGAISRWAGSDGVREAKAAEVMTTRNNERGEGTRANRRRAILNVLTLLSVVVGVSFCDGLFLNGDFGAFAL